MNDVKFLASFVIFIHKQLKQKRYEKVESDN